MIGVRLAVSKVQLIVVGVRWLFLRAPLSESGIRLAVYKGSINFGVQLAVSKGPAD